MTLHDKFVDRLAWQVRFKLEILVIRDEYQRGEITKTVYDRSTRDLAHEYRVPVWLVRALTEGDNDGV